MAYHRASLIDLYLHTKYHSNRRNFLWTDGRTDVLRTYCHLNFLPSSKSHDTKTRKIQKPGPIKFRYCPLVKESAVICQLPWKIAEETESVNWRTSQRYVNVTLILDQAIWHTIMHHSSTSTYIPNIIRIEETFCGQTDVLRTYGQISRLASLGRLWVELKLIMAPPPSLHNFPIMPRHLRLRLLV